MESISSSAWIWSIAVFVYFATKDYFLAKVFNHPEFKLPVWLTTIISVAAVLVNILVQSEYQRYLGLSYIKGAIQLPNFSLIFIVADCFSTLFSLVLLAPKKGLPMWREPGARVLVEILRLTMLVIIVPSVIGFFWTRETLNDRGWGYQCFKYQMRIDLASYYYQNKQFPNSLERFTSIRINPFNNAPLLYEYRGDIDLTILDSKGNTILEAPKDLIGIHLYLEDPSKYFVTFEIANRNVCDGTLRLPKL